MRIKIIAKIASKNLSSHRLRTILTVAGVTIGISSILFLVSLGYGLEQLVTSQVANFDAFTTIDVPAANISTFKLDDSVIDKIKSFPHVSKIAPVTNLAGRIKKTESSSTAETIVVGAGQEYWDISGSVSEITGKMPAATDEIAINNAAITLIGEDASKIIGKTVNLDVIIPADFRASAADGMKVATSIPLKVVGVLSDNTSPIVYTSSDFLKSQGAVKYSSLKLKADNKDNVATLRKQLENIGFSTEYVGDTVDQISQVFSLFRIILVAFGMIALIVAALGTFNTLTISLLERIREIGLLKALGMRNRDVYKLFLAESLIIGILGGLMGVILGYSLGLGINFILSTMAHRAHAESIKVFVTPWFVTAVIAIFSIFVGFLTGWYPSRRAVKIDPLDALRYE